MTLRLGASTMGLRIATRKSEMDSIRRALYVQMKLTVLATTLNGETGCPFSRSYLYAWDSDVYPLCDDGAPWHAAHEEQFRVRKAALEELYMHLNEQWYAKQPVTFYELETRYDARSGRGVWDRGRLVHACRYLFLSECFNAAFWAQVTENGTCPTEAHGITRPDADSIYFQ